MTQKYHIKTEQLAFYFLFIIGILIRLDRFPEMLAGLNCDEAYSLYESLTLLRYGTDSWGYTWPVYLTAWGSGMNVLQSVLMIPFVALLGPTKLAARLPIMICYILSMPAFYYLIKKFTGDKKAGLVGLALIAFSPWHYTMSRFALESNLASVMCVFAGAFMAKGVEDNRYYLPAAFFFGLTLYSYATMWIVVPIILIAILTYLIMTKKISINKWLISAIAIVFFMALPLMLFLLINAGIIPEIRSFISIPKLSLMRSAEISLANIPANIGLYIQMLTKGISPWQSFYGHGAYLHIGLLFLLVGIAVLIKKIIKKDLSSKEKLFLALYVILTIYGLCIFDLNENKVNFLHFPNTILIIYGVCFTAYKLKNFLLKNIKSEAGCCCENAKRTERKRCLSQYSPLILIALIISNFVVASNVYFGDLNEVVKGTKLSADKISEAISFASEKGDEIYLDDFLSAKVSWLLLATELTPEEWQNGVTFANDGSNGWYDIKSVKHDDDNFFFLDSDKVERINRNAIYLLGENSDGSNLIAAGAKNETFGSFTVYWFE